MNQHVGLMRVGCFFNTACCRVRWHLGDPTDHTQYLKYHSALPPLYLEQSRLIQLCKYPNTIIKFKLFI